MAVMPYLMKSKLSKQTQGQQELVNLVAEKIEINDKFDPLEEETHNTDRLILCIECILPLFSVRKYVPTLLDLNNFRKLLFMWHMLLSLKIRENQSILF